MTEPDEALLWARENTASTQSSPYTYALARAYRAGAAASAERIKELEAQVEVLDWLTYQTDLQLSWDADPEEDWAWRVHGVTGNVNDREWRLIAEGETPLAALKNARALLKESDQ